MFSVIIPGRPCITDMVAVSANQSAFNFPSAPHFSHIVVFILPGNVLPDGTAAAVYVQLPGEGSFRFLGAIANEKPSAIFKVNLPGSTSGGNDINAMNMEMNGMTGGPLQDQGQGQSAMISLGISVEPVANIQVQLNQLKEQQNISAGAASSISSTALALVKRQTPPTTTKLLAQKIIQNAFNFLASFAGNLGPGGQEVVPLKSFEDWWKKFERRIENDPGFLERDG